jgi:hypothetical protein
VGRRGHGHGRCEKAQLLILATTRAKNGEFGDGQKIVQLIGKYVNGQRIRQLTGEFVDGQTIGPLLHSLANPLTDRKLFNSHIWNSLTDRQSVNSLAEFIDGQTIGQLVHACNVMLRGPQKVTDRSSRLLKNDDGHHLRSSL